MENRFAGSQVTPQAPHVGSRRAPIANNTIPRHNVYVIAHKALRLALGETLVAAGRVDANDEAEVAALITQVRALLVFCRAHLDKEEQFVHPAIEARQPGAATATRDDHRDHLVAFEQLNAEVRSLESATGSERETTGAQLYRHLALFVADNLAHMDVEESDNNAALWSAYSDAELQALEERLVASIPQDVRKLALRWLVPALNPAERATLLLGIRDEVPAIAFDAIFASAQAGLTDAERRKLKQALTQ